MKYLCMCCIFNAPLEDQAALPCSMTLCFVTYCRNIVGYSVQCSSFTSDLVCQKTKFVTYTMKYFLCLIISAISLRYVNIRTNVRLKILKNVLIRTQKYTFQSCE
jgi:hypothetical protein